MQNVVKRLLSKHDFPLEMENEAGETVVKQAELICEDWYPATAEV
ncbi:MAG: type I restriction enzyme endonuclease domain-containing protein [Candidatus Thorarchaeota archaeon]